MAVRFTGIYFSLTKQNELKLEVHDNSFFGTATSFDLKYIQEESGGDESEIYEPIKTSLLKVGIIANSPEIFSFINDLTNFEEERFYVTLQRRNNLLFRGMIVVDSIELSDEFMPDFAFTAIDGITFLKEKTFSWPDDTIYPYVVMNIKDLIIYCLNYNPVFDNISATDNICVIASNLQMQNDYFDGLSFYLNCYLFDYFFEYDNSYNKTNKLKAWNVLIEILSRFGLYIRYYKGLYVVLSVESWNEQWQVAAGFKKNGTAVGIPIPSGSVDVSNVSGDVTAFSASYNFRKGLKSVEYTSDAKYHNLFIGAGASWTKKRQPKVTGVAPLEEDSVAKSLGILEKNENYFGEIILDVNENIGSTYATPGVFLKFLKFKISIIAVNQDNGTNQKLVLSDKPIRDPASSYELSEIAGQVRTEWIIPFSEYGHRLLVTIPPASFERDLIVRIWMDESDGLLKQDLTNLTFSTFTKLHYNTSARVDVSTELKTTEIVVKSSIAEKTGRIHKITSLAGQEGAKNTVKAFGYNHINPVAGQSRTITDWRYSNLEPWDSLERSMTKKILEYSNDTQKKLSIVFAMPLVTAENNQGRQNAYMLNVLHRGELYIPTKFSINHLADEMRIVGIKKQTKTTKTIEISDIKNEVELKTVNFTNNNLKDLGVFEFIVNGNTLDLSTITSIPQNASIESIKNSISVYVDGIRYRQVQSTPPTIKATYSIDILTSIITLSLSLVNRVVVIDFKNNFQNATISI
jgi:hypothetical protein